LNEKINQIGTCKTVHTTYSGHETNRMDNPGKRAQDTDRRQKNICRKV